MADGSNMIHIRLDHEVVAAIFTNITFHRTIADRRVSHPTSFCNCSSAQLPIWTGSAIDYVQVIADEVFQCGQQQTPES